MCVCVWGEGSVCEGQGRMCVGGCVIHVHVQSNDFRVTHDSLMSALNGVCSTCSVLHCVFCMMYCMYSVHVSVPVSIF